MFDKLKSGGFYILEDLHTSDIGYNGEYGGTELNNTHRLLSDLIDGNMTGEYHITLDEFNKLLKDIESIDIVKTSEHGSLTSILRKK